MKYLKYILLALAGLVLVYLLVINLDGLGRELAIKVALPWKPMGVLIMPVWVALVLSFTLAFVLAVLLEMGAWYEYTRTIRLQRRQIEALQQSLERTTLPSPAPKSIPPAVPPAVPPAT